MAKPRPESKVDITGHAASDASPACRVVAQEEDGWLPGQAGETGAGRGQLITPDRDQDDLVLAAGIRHYSGFCVSNSPPATSRAQRPPAATSSVLGPWRSTQTVPPSPRGEPVDGSDHAHADDKHLHG
jgi:hypothetical protein